jgi:hypothetical protein
MTLEQSMVKMFYQAAIYVLFYRYYRLQYFCFNILKEYMFTNGVGIYQKLKKDVF